MDGDRRLVVEDTDEPRVPAHLHVHSHEVQRHGVEGRTDLDVAVRMHRARAALKQSEGLRGERPQRRLVRLLVVREDLTPRGAVDAHPRHRAVP
jgi:hypothetical protein